MKNLNRLPALAALLAWGSQAQDPLTLREAVRIAVERHPALAASEARVRAAGARIGQARAGYLPKVNYSESVQRSNNPVFVFGSLLNQRQFTGDNFRLDSLNNPGFISNFQSLVTVDQTLWDAGQTRRQAAAAGLSQDMSREERRGAEMQVTMNVIRSYYGATLAAETLAAAVQAVGSAQADLERAQAVRDAGMSTDADVLSIRVHLAAMREQEIRHRANLEVARAALNEALGLPLDTPHALVTPLTPYPAAPELPAWEERAARERPEAKLSALSTQIAETQLAVNKGSYWPRVGVRGAFEADRGAFTARGGANWMFAAKLEWNLFNGFADRARVQESSELLAGSRALERRTGAAVRLEVRRAHAELRAALERVQVASAAVAMAEESLRIIKNRFESGLTTTTELLRNETALLESRTRRLAAIHDSRVAAASLELASGTLSRNSEILQ
ncbi:MAG: TolC family protein [Bryobacteraceae bacterium]|nr:TolC family protein [Bryobacteraceae bacterium]